MENLAELHVEGRVTRSLRKRLASIDSDTQSRPSTPMFTKLDPINELNSPSRSVRKTRRNSTSTTPAKTPAKTPSKAAQSRAALTVEVASEEGTPMRRTTRRHSTSISIIEEEKSTLKSVALQIDALPEENSLNQPNSLGRRVTRSKSKSPQQPAKEEKSTTNTHSGKKSSKTESQTRTRKSSDEEMSDVEIVNLEEIENQKKANKGDDNKPLKKPVPENDAREKVRNEIMKQPTEKDNSFKKYLKSNLTAEFEFVEDELRTEEDNLIVSEINTSKKQTSPETKTKEIYFDSDVDHLFDEHNLLIDLDAEGIEIETYRRDGKNSPADLEDELGENDEKSTSNKRSPVVITDDVKLQRITPERIAHYANIKDTVKDSPKSSGNYPSRDAVKDATEIIKCVNFKESSDDVSIKNSYPTTPFVVRSKSYIERNLLREAYKKSSAKTLENNDIAEPTEESELLGIANSLIEDGDVEEEFVEVLKTPNKTFLNVIQSSTPLFLNASETQDEEQKEIKNQIEYDKINSTEKLTKTNTKQAEVLKQSEEEEPLKRSSLLETQKQEENKSLDKSNLDENLLAKERLKDTSKTHLRSANKSLKDLNEKQFEENSVANEKLEETPKTNRRSANKSLKDLNEKQFDENSVVNEKLEETPKTNRRSANKSLKDLNEKQFEENSVANEKLGEISKTHLRSANKSLKDLNEKQFDENSIVNEKLEETPKTNRRSANKSLKHLNEKQFEENSIANEKLEETPKPNTRSASKSLKDNEKQFSESVVADEDEVPKTNLRSENQSLKHLNKKQLDENLLADEHLEENSSDNKTTLKEKQSFASSWTQVAVKTGGKIDEISIKQPQGIITPPQLMNISNDDDAVENKKSTEKIEPHKSPTFEPDDNKSCSEDSEDGDNDDEDNGIEDDEPIEELAGDEEPYNNCSLVLDEAMEADDDYQSGDSMDSEELREMKENEIPVDYESIGSGDTTEDEVEDDDDEDDASFIVQDSETERAENSCFVFSDDDEHLLDGESKNKKNQHKYKRVLTIESSDSDQEEESGSSRSSFEKDNQSLTSKSNKTPKEHIIEATLDNLGFPNKEVSKIGKASTVEEKEKASMDFTEQMERPPKTVKRNSDFLITIVDSKVDCKENKKLIKSNISIQSDDEEYESAEMLPLVINEEDDDEHNEDGDFKPNLDNKPGKNLNSSKLSETALKLQEDTSEENTDHQDENNHNNDLNLSQKHLIKKLHPSERLNKTIHELRGAIEQEDNSSSDCEPFPVRVTRRASSLGGKNEQNKMLRNSLRKNRSKTLYPVATNETVFSSEEEDRPTTENEEVASSKRRSGFGKSVSKQLESNNESDRENEDSDETKEIRNRKEMDEFHELIDEDNTKSKHVLSVSFRQTKDLNKSNAAQAEVAHSSSTIGVTVTKKNRSITTPEPLNTSQSSLEDDDDDGTDQEESSTTSNTKMAEFSSAEEEELLSKLSNDVTQSQKITNRRHSFVNTEVAAAKKTIPTTETKASQLNLKKRNSSQINLKDVDTSSDDFNPSQSLVENIKERQQELSEKNSAKRKRLSKSFCEGGGVGELETTEHGEVRHLHKKLKQSNAKEKTTQNDDGPKTRTQKILGRCDEILEAANRAKLQSKQNFHKSTVKLLKPKKVKKIVKPVKDNEEKQEEENEILIQKELKRQEQAKAEVEKALQASANIMMKKPLNTKTKLVVSQDVSVAAPKVSSDPDSIPSKPKKSKAPQLISILPAANVKRSHQHAPHKLKSSAGEVIEVPITEKKKKPHNEIQLSTGVVRVESLTPKKQRLQSGFRESPATPRSLGFKVRHILTVGQDTPPEIPAVLGKDGKRKRRKIEEPRNTLPKPQWTQSGIFMEEDLYPSIPVASTGSTQFMVTTLNDGRKKVKKSVTAVDAGKGKSSCSNSALLFKKNALFRDNIPRETSHELLLRKQRQQFHSHY